MPGSEGGDRVHNFFDQEKFSHQHLLPQVFDGSNLGSSSSHWPGNQRHESTPLSFSPGHTASAERGYLDRQSNLDHSSPYLQSPQRPSFVANPHLVQHASLNGHVHDHHHVQAKHDETDLMAINSDSNQHNPFARGLLNSGAQFRNVPEQHQDARLEATESTINFDFLGSHKQLNSQQLGMLQSSPRQHSGLNERQLLQQQAMLKNLYDVQRQQQWQKQDIKQLNPVNNLPSGQKMPNNRSSSLNITSFQDGSNYARMPQHVDGNSNWPQNVFTPYMHGISNGMSFPTEQSAPLHSFGFSPQSVDHSLYGFPISNTRSPSRHHSHSMEKPMTSSQQGPTESNPVSADQYGILPDQVSVQDREFGSRYGFQKNNNHMNASNQVSYPGAIMENSLNVESQQRDPSLEFLRIPGLSSSSMKSKENTSQTGIFQDAAPLDPSEEQFLFGSDDNIWDAFGKSSDFKLKDYKMVEGSDIRNQFPSVQNGSWTALMQSALAETCSGVSGNQEEWSGLNHIGKPASADHEVLTFNNSEKQRTWVNNGNLLIKPSLDMNNCMSHEKTGAANSHSLQEFSLSSLSGPAVNERFQLNSASKSNQLTAGFQANKKSSHGTFMGSVPGNSSPVRSTLNENTMHPRHDEQKRFMREEMQNKSALSRNSFYNSPSPIGQENPNSVATGPTINSSQDNLNGSQYPPVSNDYNHWKTENVARSQHPPEAQPHVFDSSFNSHDKKFQQHDSFMDSTSGSRLQDTFMSGQSNPSVADMKKVSSLVAGNSPGIGKYHYHPSGQELINTAQNDKGKGSNSTGMHKLHETSSLGLSMHHLANKTTQSSRNMLELLNEAGRSRENSAEASRNSSEQNMLSEKPAEESPDTSMSPLQQNHSFGSQTYGLQLGPPHQRIPTQIRGPSEAPSSLGLNSGQFVLHHPPAVSQAELHGSKSGGSVSLHKVQEHSYTSVSSGPSILGNQFQNQTHEGHRGTNPLMPAGTVISQLDHTDKLLANASIMSSSGGTQFNTLGSNGHSAYLPSSSYQADKCIQSNIGHKDLGSLSSWTNFTNLQGSSQPDILASQSHMKASVIPLKKDELNPAIRGNDLRGSGAQNMAFTRKPSGEDLRTIGSSWKRGVPDGTGLELKEANIPGKDGFPYSDITHASPEISGQSAKSDGKPQNSYSLLHQLRVMRSSETDPSKMDSKRLKVQSSSSDSQQSPSRFGQHQSSYSPSPFEIGNSKSAVSSDAKLGNFVSVPSINQGSYFPLQHGNTPFQNTPTFGQNRGPAVSSSLHPKISPQMAPTWFEQYGSLNREQLVPPSDVWKHTLSGPLELGQTLQNSSTSFLSKNHVAEISAPSFANEVWGMKNCSALERIEKSASPQPAELASPSFMSVVPCKLKTATLELLPWYKEVQWHGLRDLPSISSCEVKWACTTKRIPEVVDEVERTDNRTLKCKTRLVLTTQLLQQLLDPPPTSVMSSDAYMNYESIVYFTSRVSCGGACSLPGLKIYRTMSPDHYNMLYKKELEIGDDLLSKVENEFLIRASKLENSLSSLDKQTSIQDLQIEMHDLEKFSVINRFARFHGRGQADGPVVMNSVMNSQSHGPQRYVTALPSPRNLPDNVQCLSL